MSSPRTALAYALLVGSLASGTAFAHPGPQGHLGGHRSAQLDQVEWPHVDLDPRVPVVGYRQAQRTPLGSWLSSSGRTFTLVRGVDGALDVIQGDGNRRSVHQGTWTPTPGGVSFQYGSILATYDAHADLVHAGGYVWQRVGARTETSRWASTSGNRFVLLDGAAGALEVLQTDTSGNTSVWQGSWVDPQRTQFQYVAHGTSYLGTPMLDGRIKVDGYSTTTYWTQTSVGRPLW